MGVKKAGKVSDSDKLDGIAKAVVGLQGDVADIRQKLAEKSDKTDIGRILGAIDAFARKAENYDRKSYSHPDILQDHESRLQSMDGLLKRLEVGT